MAIGGFINGLRPLNLAIPLLQNASSLFSRYQRQLGERKGAKGRSGEIARCGWIDCRRFVLVDRATEGFRQEKRRANCPPFISLVLSDQCRCCGLDEDVKLIIIF